MTDRNKGKDNQKPTTLDELKAAIEHLTNNYKDFERRTGNAPGGRNEKNKGKGSGEIILLECIQRIRSSKWVGLIRYNKLTDNIEKIAPIDEMLIDEGRWNDRDDLALTVWLNEHGIKASDTVACKAITHVAVRDRPFDPIEEAILALPDWDGVKRLDTWLIDYAGSPDTDYVRLVGRKFLLQMLARATKPGCKADNTLILERRQRQIIAPTGIGRQGAIYRLYAQYQR